MVSYDHRIYIPKRFNIIRSKLVGDLSIAHGGCTEYLANGWWDETGENIDGSTNHVVLREEVVVVSCITDEKQKPDAMGDCIKALLGEGEQCVLVTSQAIEAEFIDVSD